MSNAVAKFFNKSIVLLFYLVFLLVPLIFWGDTSELFEFNKMWLTFILTILIAVAWIGKSIADKKFYFRRTQLDIPIALFLISQIISTIFSIDQHISIWGYYTRFNGGLLSLISYFILYFALVSNLVKKEVLRVLKVGVVAGLISALWGLPSHFGHDPSCFLFRGTFDISCWTSAFAPNVRMFSTLGQPDWFAAYLSVLTPIVLAYFLLYQPSKKTQYQVSYHMKQKQESSSFTFPWKIVLFIIFALFYGDTVWTGSRSGFAGICIAIFIFLAILLLARWKNITSSSLLTLQKGILIVIGIYIVTFFAVPPFAFIQKFTYYEVAQIIQSHQPKVSQSAPAQKAPQASSVTPVGELGGTDSGIIRAYVWKGAIDVWKANPLFGTGVETFGLAYYSKRPVAHNLTSEWDFLYNKAHNEYLNYLATTGIFGIGTYLLMIGMFFYFLLFIILPKALAKDSKIRQTDFVLIAALTAGYISILISNFFGFSVVIINIYLFLIPAFVFFLADMIPSYAVNANAKSSTTSVNIYQWFFITIISLIGIFLIWELCVFWQADRDYALGYNYDKVNQYQPAYQSLHQAVALRTDEPTFWDELTVNDAIVADQLVYQKQIQQATTVANEAISVSNSIISQHPNNVVFWKDRVRVFYTLGQVNPQYLQQALDAIQHASVLAPTDAKISYNLGLIYGQTGQYTKATSVLENTIAMKPDYHDAYYALAIFYHQQAVDKKGNIINPVLEQKAIDNLHFILQHFDNNDAASKQSLKSWGAK